MRITAPYQRYAGIYDLTGQTSFALLAWRRARQWLLDRGWRGGSALELACGTGALAARMRVEGLAVVGLDRSREMLLAAHERDPAVPWCQGEFQALNLADHAFDLVTCFYDSLNYVTSQEELSLALAEVARVLRPGGWFIFDLNTPFTLREHWTGLCSAVVEDEYASVWDAQWDEARQVSSLRATFFVRRADGAYDRFDEVHDERGFEPRELRRALAAAGLELVREEDHLTQRAPDRETRRVLYFVRRAG